MSHDPIALDTECPPNERRAPGKFFRINAMKLSHFSTLSVAADAFFGWFDFFATWRA